MRLLGIPARILVMPGRGMLGVGTDFAAIMDHFGVLVSIPVLAAVAIVVGTYPVLIAGVV